MNLEVWKRPLKVCSFFKFYTNCQVTKEILGLKPTDNIQLVEFPPRKGALAALLSKAAPADNSDDKDSKFVAAQDFYPIANTSWMHVVSATLSQSEIVKGLLPMLKANPVTSMMLQQQGNGIFFAMHNPLI